MACSPGSQQPAIDPCVHTHTHTQVQALLDCLADAAFSLHVCICSIGESTTHSRVQHQPPPPPLPAIIMCPSLPPAGGVGSTELSNFLTQAGLRCNLVTDQDALRHVHTPPAHLGSTTQVVYLFGDPLAAVASHYRRNHALHQVRGSSPQW